MKKKWLPILLSTLFISTVVFTAVISYRGEAKIAPPKPFIKDVLGTSEDPLARVNWELMRVRNPQTGQIPENIRQKELEFAKTLPAVELNKTAAITWNKRGPFNVGGRTRALAYDRSNANRIIAGGISGGMWVSADAGATWSKTTTSDQLHSVTSLVQDGRSGKSGIWYYGTGEKSGNSSSGGSAPYRGDGIYKSTNNGASWQLLASTATHIPQSYDNYFDYVWNIAVDNSNTTDDEVYAAVAGALYRSTNGGTSWTAVVVTSWSNWTDMAVTSTGVVYATFSAGDAAKEGIYRSTDGITFVEITPGGWPANYNRVVLDIAASNEKVVYFLAETPGTGTSGHNLWKYTYVSGDGTGAGGTWVDRSASIPNEGGLTGNFDSQSSYDLIIKVKPDDENFVIIGGTNLYTSSDGFSSTTNTNWIGGYTAANNSYARYANHHPDQHSISFNPTNSSILLSGHDGGITKTSNIAAATVVWSVLNTGYYTTQFYSVAMDHNSTGNYIVGGMQDNGSWSTSSSNVTTPWNEDLSGDGSFCAKADDPSVYYYVSWQNGGVFRFNTSNGSDWAEVDPAGGSGYLFINPFVLDPNDSKKMYLAGGNYLWRNDDLTQIPSFVQSPASVNWNKLINSFILEETISAVEVSKSPANTVYYGTAEGSLLKIANADTGDAIPEDISSISFPSGAYVSSINANSLNADEVLVVFSNYEVKSIWYSSNGGSSWSDVSGNLEENSDGSGNGPSVRWVEIVPNGVSEALYMVGTSTGLYSTGTINGTSTVWAQEGASTIGNVVVDMIDSRTTDNTVAVATHANGVYSASSIFTAIEDEDQLVPQEFSLEQNYPNPFNPSTTIRYKLDKAEAVTLTVFDISGKKVAELLRGNQAAGLHTVSWNGKNNSGQPVPSGTYVYRLTTGSKTEARKMTLVK